MPDLFHVIDRLGDTHHDVISLGNYQKNLILHELTEKTKEAPFYFENSLFSSAENNMGMMMTAEFIKQHIMSNGDDFCLYDDYNWDYSLMHLSSEIETKPWRVLSPTLSRLQHMGIRTCGTHVTKHGECDVESILKSFEFEISKLKDNLFPETFVPNIKQKTMLKKLPYRSGGWGDQRDILLCLAIKNSPADINLLPIIAI